MEQKVINEYFKSQEIFLFDIQFRDKVFVERMFADFKKYLIQRDKEYLIKDVLLYHPFLDILQLSNFGDIST
jgi:hypothetical protein